MAAALAETVPVPSLEEMARMRQAAVDELESAYAARKDIEPIYHAALAWVAEARKRVETVDQAMEAAKRQYAIERALDELGVSHRPVPQFVFAARVLDANVWNLVAVGPEGTGLYELRFWGRRGRRSGKSFAVHGERVEPEPGKVRAHRPNDSLWYETPEEEREVGLRRWSERGRGDFGAGSGATRPKAPPEGGRWRWLKLREQEELTSGD